MLPVSDLRHSLPNTRENISVENFFFKNSDFPAFVTLFFFPFFSPFSPSPDIYWTPPICKHPCAPVCFLLIPSFTHLMTKCMCTQTLSHVLLFCNPMECSPPGSSVHGISQARMLEWVAISYSRGSSWPKDQTLILCTAGKLPLHHLGRLTSKHRTNTTVTNPARC